MIRFIPRTLALSLIFLVYFLLPHPPSLFSDEVDTGYQAFIFNHCRSDYAGNKFPTHFYSKADWRSPLYIYAVSLVQLFVGPTETSVRLPSLIFTFSTAIFLSSLVSSVLKSTRYFYPSLIIYLFNPWAFHFSRAGFEVTGMILSVVIGIYCWVQYLTNRRLPILLLSLIGFAAAPYFYSTAKLYIPILFVLTLIIWRTEIISFPRKHLLVGSSVFLILSIPLLLDTFNGKSGYRFSYLSIFTEPTVASQVDYDRYLDSISDGATIGARTSFSSKLVHNKLNSIAGVFFKNYLSAFSVDFHFLSGDANLRQGLSQYGNFHFIDILLITIGILASFGTSLAASKTNRFLQAILFLAPIPFALTRDVDGPHATRLMLMLPPLVYFIILGLRRVATSRKLLAVVILIYAFSLYNFLHFYQYHYPQLSVRDWHFGIKDSILLSTASPDKKVFFTDTNQPFTLFYLFYSRFLPPTCQPLSQIKDFNNLYFSGSTLDSQYFFGSVDWDSLFRQDPGFDQYLFVISPEDRLRLDQSLGRSPSINGLVIHYHLLSQPTKKYFNEPVYDIIYFTKSPASS